MSGLFGNRGYWLKVGIGLLLIFGGFYWSGRRGPEVSPTFIECLLRPEKSDGARVWVHRAKIETVDAGRKSFTVRSHGVSIEVVGDPGECAVGSEATLTGRFRRSEKVIGGRLELDRIEPLVRPDEIRLIIEGISIVVLILVLLRFVRVFRVRLEDGVVGRRPRS